MKFELDWRPDVEEGCVKPDYPHAAVWMTPETNKEMAILERIKSSGLKIKQSNNHDSIQYYVVIEPEPIILQGNNNWSDEREIEKDDELTQPKYSIKCFFGFHKWKYNKERKAAVIPYETQRKCMRCRKKQTAAFDGIEILWRTVAE